MAYDAPTAEQFRARFPAFAATPFDAVASALLEAVPHVDESWPEESFALGRMLYAAHILTLDGQGSTREAQLAGFRRLKLSSLELERDASKAAFGALSSTSYGVRFLDLVRLYFPAVAVA